MTTSVTPWTGDWSEGSEPLASNDELVREIASRRDCSRATIRAELERVDENFDVDATYVEPP